MKISEEEQNKNNNETKNKPSKRVEIYTEKIDRLELITLK